MTDSPGAAVIGVGVMAVVSGNPTAFTATPIAVPVLTLLVAGTAPT